jgi:hypothetical protein
MRAPDCAPNLKERIMEKIDKLITDALAEEDAGWGAMAEEPAFLAQAFGLFRGRNAWIWMLMTVVQTVMFFVGVWAAWKFFHTQDVILALRYGLSATVLLLMATAIKFAMMPVIEARHIIREIRRAELQRIIESRKTT